MYKSLLLFFAGPHYISIATNHVLYTHGGSFKFGCINKLRECSFWMHTHNSVIFHLYNARLCFPTMNLYLSLLLFLISIIFGFQSLFYNFIISQVFIPFLAVHVEKRKMLPSNYFPLNWLRLYAKLWY
jgi:hypothetical protein